MKYFAIRYKSKAQYIVYIKRGNYIWYDIKERDVDNDSKEQSY